MDRPYKRFYTLVKRNAKRAYYDIMVFVVGFLNLLFDKRKKA